MCRLCQLELALRMPQIARDQITRSKCLSGGASFDTDSHLGLVSADHLHSARNPARACSLNELRPLAASCSSSPSPSAAAFDHSLHSNR
jgi:hypothetical protein